MIEFRIKIPALSGIFFIEGKGLRWVLQWFGNKREWFGACDADA